MDVLRLMLALSLWTGLLLVVAGAAVGLFVCLVIHHSRHQGRPPPWWMKQEWGLWLLYMGLVFGGMVLGWLVCRHAGASVLGVGD